MNLRKPWNSSKTSTLVALVRDERGMSTVEYVILMVVIVVGAISVWKNIGDEVKTGLADAEEEMMMLNE